ncbi:MAG: mucoidy inhibitor MuiA family protein [Opitutae bacterium]
MRYSPVVLALCFVRLCAQTLSTDTAKISEVTVYSDRAEVVKHLEGNLEAGEHVLSFENLPRSANLSTVRVQGKGDFALIDIRAEAIQTTDTADTRLKELEDKKEELSKKLEELNTSDARINNRKAALEKILTRLTTTTATATAPAEMDTTKWSSYLQFHSEALEKCDKEIFANAQTTLGVQKEINRIDREIENMDIRRVKYRNVAKVKIDVKKSGLIQLDLSYIVTGPSWRPSYDVRANTVQGNLELTYNAEVRQSTGEDWKGVALKLSTAQPGIGGREPHLSPWLITKQEAIVAMGAAAPMAKSASRPRQDQMVNTFELRGQAAEANAPAEMEIKGASVVTGATAETYIIDRVSDVLSDNKVAKVNITKQNYPTVYRYSSVPKLSPHVYLKAKAKNKSDFTLLPGQTSVFLDGAFVANASLDLVPAGQEFWTYLGVDPSVKVERKELGRREETSGIFGKKTVRTVYDNVFKIKNSKSTAIELVVWDQIPISDHEDIKVVLEEPKYEKDSENLKMSDGKLLEWRFNLKPDEKKEAPFRFVIERPEGTIIQGL